MNHPTRSPQWETNSPNTMTIIMMATKARGHQPCARPPLSPDLPKQAHAVAVVTHNQKREPRVTGTLQTGHEPLGAFPQGFLYQQPDP